MKTNIAWVGKLYGLLLVLGCSCGGEPGLLVQIEAWPAGAETLHVQRWLDGAEYDEIVLPDRERTFMVSLPEGRSGQVRVLISAVDGTGCKVASGEVSDSLGPALRVIREHIVRLSLLGIKTCPLKIEARGQMAVRSEPMGIDCGDRCKMDVPWGSRVKLSAVSGPLNVLASWGTTCSEIFDPSESCEIELEEARHVRVERVTAEGSQERRPAMRKLLPGVFLMGSTTDDPDSWPEDRPQHMVQIQAAFAMAVTELTQQQYQQVMGVNPSYFPGDPVRPVEQVTWFDAVSYCNTLSVLEGLPACYQIERKAVLWPEGVKCRGYRLPTEGEWEYAARAGTATKYAGSDNADEVAWYGNNSGNTTHPVGTKKANAWGLFDLSGNVLEWIWDEYAAYDSSSQKDPVGPLLDGSQRVQRGGFWGQGAGGLRVAARRGENPGDQYRARGFRVVRSYP